MQESEETEEDVDLAKQLEEVASTLQETEEILYSLDSIIPALNNNRDLTSESPVPILSLETGAEPSSAQFASPPTKRSKRSWFQNRSLRYSVQLSHNRKRSATNEYASLSTVESDIYGFPIESEEQRNFQPFYAKHLEEQKKNWKAYLIRNKFRIDKSSMQLKTLVRKGIPPNTRKEAWLACSGAKKNLQLNPGYYEKVLLENRNSQSISYQQIEMDAPRTFPNHPYFNQEGQNKLKRVLLAYSWRNTVVGYCQSMNYIAGMLLLFMKEEEAFWMLCAIMEEVQPADYYGKNLLGVQIDQRVFSDLVQKKLPQVAQHLEKFDLPLSLVTTQWFSCLFVKDFPAEVALRVWDCLFLEGNKILFRVGLALLSLNAKSILETMDYQSLFILLKEMAPKMHDCEMLMKAMFEGVGPFPRKKIARLRNSYYPVVLEEQRQLEAAREKMLAHLRNKRLAAAIKQEQEDVLLGTEKEQEETRASPSTTNYVADTASLSPPEGTECSTDSLLEEQKAIFL